MRRAEHRELGPGRLAARPVGDAGQPADGARARPVDGREPERKGRAGSLALHLCPERGLAQRSASDNARSGARARRTLTATRSPLSLLTLDRLVVTDDHAAISRDHKRCASPGSTARIAARLTGEERRCRVSVGQAQPRARRRRPRRRPRCLRRDEAGDRTGNLPILGEPADGRAPEHTPPGYEAHDIDASADLHDRAVLPAPAVRRPRGPYRYWPVPTRSIALPLRPSSPWSTIVRT